MIVLLIWKSLKRHLKHFRKIVLTYTALETTFFYKNRKTLVKLLAIAYAITTLFI